ncbi:MAG TPA: 2-C-methyl-D-erythritol 4-phosphate cytidylyltransferase [Gemmatimonadales bacterium]|nr:2-C-methyl-D-erythritol 4-phosphate cytidylyltransferase [Gemmatimonadales bacterium]
MPLDVGVVVVAAGRGLRLGGVPKQFRDLSGVPVLRSALEPFLSHPEVIFTVAVLPPDMAENPPGWLAEITGLRLAVVAGGSERTDSVRAGLAALPDEAQVVLVHDGARPFPAREVIDQVIQVARSGRAAVAAIPLADTLKEAERTDRGITVRRTIPRDELWRAQTPQGFPRALLTQAHTDAGGFDATDDAQLVERLGFPVVLVPDVPTNLKITTLEDLEMADALIARRLTQG